MTWEVRKNCEYCRIVEAKTADEACEKADQDSLDDWDQAWSSTNAEPYKD